MSTAGSSELGSLVDCSGALALGVHVHNVPFGKCHTWPLRSHCPCCVFRPCAEDESDMCLSAFAQIADTVTACSFPEASTSAADVAALPSAAAAPMPSAAAASAAQGGASLPTSLLKPKTMNAAAAAAQTAKHEPNSGEL